LTEKSLERTRKMVIEKITKRYSIAVKQEALEGISKGLYTKSETAKL